MMAFVSATQTTDLDRADTIREAVAGALLRREMDPKLSEVDEGQLIERAQLGEDAATLELVARHEPRIRALVSECRVSNGAPVQDLHQAALLGFLDAIQRYEPGAAAFFTFARPYVRLALTEANRASSPVPVATNNHKRYFAAMRAADGDPVIARRWTALQRLSIAALEVVAESGDRDAGLAREIVDARVDVYEAHVRRGYVSTGRGRGERTPVPSWEEYREQRGRGLTGPEFDLIHAALTYESLDAPAEGDEGSDTEARDASARSVMGEPGDDPFTAVEDGVAFGQLLSVLDARERDIILRHLGGATDREIAEALGLSRPRVVTVRSKAIDRMRRAAGTASPRKGKVAAHPGWKGHPYHEAPYNGCGRA